MSCVSELAPSVTLLLCVNLFSGKTIISKLNSPQKKQTLTLQICHFVKKTHVHTHMYIHLKKLTKIRKKKHQNKSRNSTIETRGWLLKIVFRFFLKKSVSLTGSFEQTTFFNGRPIWTDSLRPQWAHCALGFHKVFLLCFRFFLLFQLSRRLVAARCRMMGLSSTFA